MTSQIIPQWKQSPFIRISIPFIAGIIASWYWHCSIMVSCYAFGISIGTFFLFGRNKAFVQYKFKWIRGVLLNIVIFDFGVLLLSCNDQCIGNTSCNQTYKPGDVVIAVLEEPLAEKSKTFKAEASVETLIRNDSFIRVKTNILLYLQKDSTIPSLNYGSKIIFYKGLEKIKNSPSLGGFDYERYCRFQHISYQVYLAKNSFILLPQKQENILKKYLFLTREKLLTTLRTFLRNKKETGLAEALLIGYKTDLDKDLIKSYTQTGVVHIIAISGLHLALIYSLLQFLLKKIKTGKKIRWIKPVVLISCLWLFSFLSGASPSVLRSALMFSFIIIGAELSKSGSIYNSLAASAFLLLCYNPFWLWDIGFQLSYGAVLSIVIFMQPIYNSLYIRNKLLDFLWKSTSITLAAQILTSPVSVYNFHQFPNYFLPTNLFAVPLSSLVLLGELFVCVTSFIPAVARIVGDVVSWLIFILNSFIEHMQALPFSTLENLYINLAQLLVIYLIIIYFNFWLMKKNEWNQ